MTHVLLALAALAYCAAGTGYIAFLVAGTPAAARMGVASLRVGLVLHGVAIAARAFQYGFTPALDVQDGLSLLAWFLGLTYAWLNRRLKLPILGAFVVPLMLAVALPALSLPGPARPLPAALHSALLPFHVTVAILGYAAFGIASLVGIAYLLQERELKARHAISTLWSRLPSLELMDRLNRTLTATGFVLLTVTIITGAFFAHRVWGHVLSLFQPSELMAMVTWGLYGVLMWGRVQSGWRGRRAAVLTLVGFTVAMFSFVGLSFCPADRHGGTFQ